MNRQQIELLNETMNRYELTIKHGNSLISQIDIEKVIKVREQLGMTTNFCRTCLSEVLSNIKPIYEQWKISK